MNKAIERQINRIYKIIFKKVFNNRNIQLLSKGSRMNIEESLLMLQSSNAYNKFAQEFSKALAKKGLIGQKGVWRKYYEAAKKARYIALPTTFKEFELNVYEKTVKHNFEMIKSIPIEMMEVVNHKYTTTLIQEVIQGSISRGTFKKQLQSHGFKQAEVIARTETAKLQTAVTEQRSKEIGSVAYVWRSSNDKRTRPSHRAMNDVIVFWRPYEQKPLLDNMKGNAGEFPNCRCDARPIIDVDDLIQPNYKVYDYIQQKVITMSKKSLIESLQKGEL